MGEQVEGSRAPAGTGEASLFDSVNTQLFQAHRRRGVCARALADRAYVLETGRITLSGAAAAVGVDGRVREAYLGV